MNFPAASLQEVQAPADLVAGLGIEPEQVLAASDYVVVLASEDDVKAVSPIFSQWLNLDLRGVIVTAPGKDVDFVSRCFFPALGINEDPVTGSAHCELAPYWGARLGRQQLLARQLSERSGLVDCRLVDDRVHLCGRAVDYMQGQITIN
jgi:predicted PhzF superfamily epimerase YddE/YHI9